MLPSLKPNYSYKDKKVSSALLNALTNLLEKTEVISPLNLSRNPDGSWVLSLDQDVDSTTTGLTSTDLSTGLSSGITGTGTVSGTVTGTGTGTTPPTCTPGISVNGATVTITFADCTQSSFTIDVCAALSSCTTSLSSTNSTTTTGLTSTGLSSTNSTTTTGLTSTGLSTSTTGTGSTCVYPGPGYYCVRQTDWSGPNCTGTINDQYFVYRNISNCDEYNNWNMCSPPGWTGWQFEIIAGPYSSSAEAMANCVQSTTTTGTTLSTTGTTVSTTGTTLSTGSTVSGTFEPGYYDADGYWCEGPDQGTNVGIGEQCFYCDDQADYDQYSGCNYTNEPGGYLFRYILNGPFPDSQCGRS